LRTYVIAEADVVLIPDYLHVNEYMTKYVKQTEAGVPSSIAEFIDIVVSRITDKSKFHVLTVPTWNPTTSNFFGIPSLMKLLKVADVIMWSLGFTGWQGVKPERIIPVPYVVDPKVMSVQQLAETTGLPRTENFVFYSEDCRESASVWGGCNLCMISPLANCTDMHVRLVKGNNRLSQDEYNHRMHSSDYCLLLCGDTPTSRSLASPIYTERAAPGFITLELL
jgi:hypothetical protein